MKIDHKDDKNLENTIREVYEDIVEIGLFNDLAILSKYPDIGEVLARAKKDIEILHDAIDHFIPGLIPPVDPSRHIEFLEENISTVVARKVEVTERLRASGWKMNPRTKRLEVAETGGNRPKQFFVQCVEEIYSRLPHSDNSVKNSREIRQTISRRLARYFDASLLDCRKDGAIGRAIDNYLLQSRSVVPKKQPA